MPTDAQVKAAIAHWGARFVANGVVLTDFEEVTGELERYDDWCAAWSARAAHHEQLGREALTSAGTSSPPANACSAPASITISRRSCSCTTWRR